MTPRQALFLSLLFAPLGPAAAAPPAGPAETPAPPPVTEPAKTFRPGDCREFDRVIEVDGKEKVVSGKLCLQADGTWKVAE